jgi:single-stranded DNA-binding protein
MQRFQLMGNLGSDAKITTRTTAKGESQEYAFLSIAVNSKSGDKSERTDWYSVAVFNPFLVDLMKQHGVKGKQLFVEGDMSIKLEGEGANRRDIAQFSVGRQGIIRLCGGTVSGTTHASDTGSDDLPQGDA